jgi:hypothetical protein
MKIGERTRFSDSKGNRIRVGDRVMCAPSRAIRWVIWCKEHEEARISNNVMSWSLEKYIDKVTVV